MAVQATVRSYLGIAKEVTKGTAIAPTKFIPVSASKLKATDIIDPLYDEGLRGSNVKTYAYIAGRTRSTVEWGGPVYPDTFPWAIAGLLGTVTTTGVSVPYSHVVTTENATAVAADAQPTSLTLTDYYAANVRAYSGCQVHDVSFSFNSEGLLDYDAKATGWLSSTASTPTPTFTTVLPAPTWQGTVTIGGSAVSYAVEGSLNMSRPVTPIYGIANTQNPFSVFVGPVEVTGQLRFVMEADTELTRFLTNTQPSISLDWSNGTGASLTQIKAVLTKGAYTTAMIDRGKDYVEVVIDLTGISNVTDGGGTQYSPIAWTFQNAIATNIYQ
jgi:hypothetical protein